MDYYSKKIPSFSTLKHFITGTPAHYLKSIEEGIAPSEAMKLGSALHTVLLEAHKIDEEYAFFKSSYDNYRTKASKEERQAFEEQNEGKIVIDSKKRDSIFGMRDAVYKNKKASLILNHKDSQREVEMIQEYTTKSGNTHTVKGKSDIINPTLSFVADIKTCTDASDKALGATIAKYLYYMQAAIYVNLANKVLKPSKPITAFYFIFIEKGSNIVRVEALSPYYLDLGIERFDECLDMLTYCQEFGFGGYKETPKGEFLELNEYILNAHEQKFNTNE